MRGKEQPHKEDPGDAAGRQQAELRYPDEDEEGLYGWKFHRGPLLVAIVLTVIFYIFVFLWVD